ncbi:PepSY domain-containing protein, partial [Streptomyces sp. NPDC056231]
VWEVEIVDANGAEHEVTVDAQTGKVTATKADEDTAKGAQHSDRTGDSDTEED